ncbi:MAG: hypothetical protein CV087_10040 [Candidatus Brocadia sp. WS118]|nr:MAG: hypothetical protein CV087_10040 [Candidatus Brocadia sp. WS118]
MILKNHTTSRSYYLETRNFSIDHDTFSSHYQINNPPIIIFITKPAEAGRTANCIKLLREAGASQEHSSVGALE